MKGFFTWFVNLCAVWIILAYVAGYFQPDLFLFFSKGRYMTMALSLVMLCMGLSLKLSDFGDLFKQPKCIILAALSQYTIMPFFGWLIARGLQLPPALAVGFIIVACCPGGMASNLIALIGRANISLSVVSTAVSTVLGIVMTPLLTYWLAGGYIKVDIWGMLLNVIEMVLLPVSLGVFINWKFPGIVKRIGQGGAVISTLCVTMVSGAAIAPTTAVPGGREELLAYAGIMLMAATLLHGAGFGLGYTLGRLFKYDSPISKSISCETGMQNGGLAVTLARNNFPMYLPVVCLPSVFCSIIQSIIGGILASVWRMTSKEKDGQ